jgi:Ca-activated chloride channel family protein
MRSNGESAVMLLGVKANGAVKGRLLVMTLEQHYRNSSDTNTEITYTFPLPLGAVLMDVEVNLNGKVLKGEVSLKATAQTRYEEALLQGDSSILLAQNYDGSFTLELGNLMARETCTLLIRYAQTLATEHGQVRLMLPTTIAPRFGNPLTQGHKQPHQVPVTDLMAQYPFDITLTLMGDMAHTNVGSPSHKTSYSRIKDNLVVQLSQRGYLDRDFVLLISNLKNESDAMVCADQHQVGQYALMAFFSPHITSTGTVGADGSSPTGAMTAKVLVDCSSSMAGDSIEAARRALKGIVEGLGPADKFSLSRFGDMVEHRSRGMWSGTAQAKASALRWVEHVHANLGGTEMANALVTTIAIADAGKSDILLITDGEIEGIDEVIDIAMRSKHRVFVVAIGASPAEVHLRRLATATGGHCDFVAPGEAVEPAVLRMSARMRSVRATELRVEWPASVALSWAQKVQSYAFEHDVFNVCAFATAPDGLLDGATVKLLGRLDGQDGEVLLGEANLSLSESNTNILARLTAYVQYKELVDQRNALRASPALSNAKELALAYQLITDETNFILVHERLEADKAQAMPEAHQVPQMLAAGWGGTGSVVRSSPRLQPLHNSQSASASLSYSVRTSVADYNSMTTPSVWRTRDRGHAASTVDALSNGGMDAFDIPAFLRKQADGDEPAVSIRMRQGIDKLNPLLWLSNKSPSARRDGLAKDGAYSGITPAGMDRWLSLNHASRWPRAYVDLRDLGLGIAICEWLEFEVGNGQEEAVVVATFLSVMQELGWASTGGLKGAVQFIRRSMRAVTARDAQVQDELAAEIRLGLQGTTAQVWAQAVIDFPHGVFA